MSKPTRPAVSTAALVLVVILVIGVIATALYIGNSSSSGTISSSTSNMQGAAQTSSSGSDSSTGGIGNSSSPTYCVYTETPMGAAFAVWYDNSTTPVSGANVTEVHGFNTECGGSEEDIQNTTVISFISSDSEWYALQTFNGGNETITVAYDGQTYHAGLVLVTDDYSCTILYIPSGRVDSAMSPSVCEVTQSPVASTQLYNVTFAQAGACSPSVYVAPWSVTLNGSVQVRPVNASLPSGGGYSAGPEPPSVYTIVFSVPDGFYEYVIAPQGAFYTYSGNVTVDGSNVLITLNGPVVSCAPPTNG